MISLSNGILTVQIDDKYLDEAEGKTIDRLLNTRHMIKIGNNLYTYDGLLFSDVNLTDDGSGNYVISVDNMDIVIPQANVIDKVYDETKLTVLCDMFTTICTSNIMIGTETYDIDPTNGYITLKPLSNTYIIVGDLPRMIADYIDYVKTKHGLDDADAQQYIIDTELANLAKLKDDLETKARMIFSLYIQLSKYKSVPQPWSPKLSFLMQKGQNT